MYLFKFRNCWHICDECAGLLRSAEWSVTCNCPHPPPPPSLCRYSYYHCSSQLRNQINYPVVTHNHPHLLQLLLNKYVLLCYWERWKKSDHAIPWLCLWYKLTTVLLTCVGVPSPSPPCHHMSLAASSHRCGPLHPPTPWPRRSWSQGFVLTSLNGKIILVSVMFSGWLLSNMLQRKPPAWDGRR